MQCRACLIDPIEPFLSLCTSPISNSYLTESEVNKMEPHYPLDVYFCESCSLVQIDEFETAKEIFSGNYAYFSSYSTSWLEHCRRYVDQIVERLGIDKEKESKLVVEVGSNDGYLLQYFREKKVPVLGVEPSANTAEFARMKGIPTENVFFSREFAERRKQTADLLIGNNVLAHNPNLIDFVEGMHEILKEEGAITLEFPHLMELVAGNQFDTIYHEHFSYFSLNSVDRLFSSKGLEVFDVETLPTHGGSLRVYAQKKGASREKAGRVDELIEREREAGLFRCETYLQFGERVRETKRKLLSFLIEAKNEKKRIVAYGAPAKGNTLLNYCGIRTDFIDYTVDKNPFKQGKFLPGTHIPISDPDRIFEDRPDYVLILPWNLKAEIVEQLAAVRDWGGKFIIPIPSLEVI